MYINLCVLKTNKYVIRHKRLQCSILQTVRYKCQAFNRASESIALIPEAPKCEPQTIMVDSFIRI